MIVLDASVVVELLMNSVLAGTIRSELSGRNDRWAAPHLLDIEVTSALRRLSVSQRVDAHRCAAFLDGLALFPADRYDHAPLLGRVWELRYNFTSNDAAYIALAEVTGSVLFTCDEKLRRGHRARVVVFNH